MEIKVSLLYLERYTQMLKLMYNTYSINNIIVSSRHFKFLIYCYSRLRSARDIDVTLITRWLHFMLYFDIDFDF